MAIATIPQVGITGTGYALPARIRTNDDPIFDWLKLNNPAGSDLFKGYNYRRVLALGESIVDFMVQAAQQACSEAQLNPAEIDVLIGTVSQSENIGPSDLVLLHQKLGLQPGCTIIPVISDFNNFNHSIVLATSLVETGRANNVLIAVGGNWTRYVSYQTPQSVSVSDGAGAAVISSASSSAYLRLVDSISSVNAAGYGGMYIQGQPLQIAPNPMSDTSLYSAPFFTITDQGQITFKTFGMDVPPKIAVELLSRNQISASEITLISHQASAVLTDHWNQVIAPACYINTIAEYANITTATIAVNLAAKRSKINTKYVLLLGIGYEPQSVAVLLEVVE